MSANFHNVGPVHPSIDSFLVLSVGKFVQFLISPHIRNANVLNGFSISLLFILQMQVGKLVQIGFIVSADVVAMLYKISKQV